MRPLEDASIDIVYHYYRQLTATDDVPGSALTVDPNGRSRDIGHGLDLIVGFVPTEDLEIELIMGVFFPGRAYGASADNAYFAGLEIEYSF